MTLKQEIDRFAESHSEEEIWQTIGELAKKVLKNFDASKVIEVRDAEHQTVGYFMPCSAISKPDLSDYATFIAVSCYRIAYPPDHYLSAEEFIRIIESGDD